MDDGQASGQAPTAGATTTAVVSALVSQLGLLPHPEGGYYRETYRAASAHGAGRAASTAIYYLLHDAVYSAWHRIDADEVWHIYAGGPLHLYLLSPDGRFEQRLLGSPLCAGCEAQAVVPAGWWFAAELAQPSSYVLAGCTVAPGFEFSGFELASADALRALAPSQDAWIQRLCAPQAGLSEQG